MSPRRLRVAILIAFVVLIATQVSLFLFYNSVSEFEEFAFLGDPPLTRIRQERTVAAIFVVAIGQCLIVGLAGPLRAKRFAPNGM